MKSFMAKKEQVERKWVIVDAQDAVPTWIQAIL
jgi:ribosomal protein L13